MVHEHFEIVLGGQWRFDSSSEPPSEDPFDGRDHIRSARRLACGQCWLPELEKTMLAIATSILATSAESLE
jgi:hypothetical protein